MKTKARNIVLIILALIVLAIIVLGSTIFTIKKVEVNFLESNHNMTEDSIIEKTLDINAVSMGQSVFLINKNTSSQKIEKELPYIRIINLEVIFPNVLKINCVERRECFAIQADRGYHIIDKDFKILKTVANTTLPLIDIPANDGQVGEFISNENISYYVALVQAFEKVGTYENAINTLYSNFECVKQSDYTYDFILHTRSGNSVIHIKDIQNDLAKKVNKLVAVMGTINNNTIINVYMVGENAVISEQNA